ncbi:MAG: YggT family protein [Methylocystis sp.]|nr:YggT family protein [Methylocystis sp.]MBI3274371.1 YggT family protein [Methylocystis sp.]
MQYAVVNLLVTIIDLYWWVVIIMAVMSWLIAFDVVNTRSRAVYSLWNALNALTEPVLWPIRRILPNFGGLDVSPIVLLLALSFLRDLISRGVGGQLALG